MNKLKGFLTMTPPGSISTISYTADLKKRIEHSGREKYHGKIMTSVCSNHDADTPSLPVVLKIFHRDGRRRGTRRVRACLLCWDVCGPIRVNDVTKGELTRVISENGTTTTRIKLGEVIRNLIDYDGRSKYPSQITRVLECTTHPPVRVPVSLITAQRDEPTQGLIWWWTEDAACCPFCWYIHWRFPVEPILVARG